MSYSEEIKVIQSYNGLVAGEVYKNFFNESQSGNMMNHCLITKDGSARYIPKKFCENYNSFAASKPTKATIGSLEDTIVELTSLFYKIPKNEVQDWMGDLGIIQKSHLASSIIFSEVHRKDRGFGITQKIKAYQDAGGYCFSKEFQQVPKPVQIFLHLRSVLDDLNFNSVELCVEYYNEMREKEFSEVIPMSDWISGKSSYKESPYKKGIKNESYGFTIG